MEALAPAPSNAQDALELVLQELQKLRAEVQELRAQLTLTSSSGMTVQAAADLLGASPTTVYRLLKARKLQRLRSPGRTTIISRESVLAYLAPVPMVRPVKARPTTSPTSYAAAIRALPL